MAERTLLILKTLLIVGFLRNSATEEKMKSGSLSNSCQINLGGCSYEMEVKASQECRNNFLPGGIYHHREKRSDMSGSVATESNAPVTQHDFKILSKRVSRVMEKMSVRVLRHWRNLDKKVNQLLRNGAKQILTGDNWQCPKGFITLDNWPSCYLLSKFNVSWYQAKEFCSALESDLVALGTVKEHFLVNFLIKNDPAINSADGWWTSGSFQGNRKQWMWTSHFFTKPFTFIKWGEGEPNEKGSQCMLLKRDDDHKWHDDICTQRYNFICEIKGKS